MDELVVVVKLEKEVVGNFLLKSPHVTSPVELPTKTHAHPLIDCVSGFQACPTAVM
jgi:hypothetical protein